MIYCAAEPVSSFLALDIAFPQSIEIKLNGNEVKANLRGLKNKPGSTRPADITDLVHKRPNYNNILTVTYALTTKVGSYLP
jgi:E3 SUMO-protein ligase PIAS1